MSVSISVTAQKEGKDKSRTIGYINPEATNEQLKNMAIAYNNLSTKVYQSGEKIVRTDLNQASAMANAEITLNYDSTTRILTATSTDQEGNMNCYYSNGGTSPETYTRIMATETRKWEIPQTATSVIVLKDESQYFYSSWKGMAING